MALTVAGPPTHTPLHVSLYEYPMEWFVALYIHTTDWVRRQRAEAIRDKADLLRALALVNGAKLEAAKGFVKHLVDHADALEDPVTPVDVEVDLTESQAAFLAAGRAAMAGEG